MAKEGCYKKTSCPYAVSRAVEVIFLLRLFSRAFILHTRSRFTRTLREIKQPRIIFQRAPAVDSRKRDPWPHSLRSKVVKLIYERNSKYGAVPLGRLGNNPRARIVRMSFARHGKDARTPRHLKTRLLIVSHLKTFLAFNTFAFAFKWHITVLALIVWNLYLHNCYSFFVTYYESHNFTKTIASKNFATKPYAW